MRVLILAMASALVFSATATTPPSVQPSFNGVHLGDTASRVKESKRSGQCDGSGKTLTECTLFDRHGIAYEINAGHVVRIEAAKTVAAGAKLPFGLQIGSRMETALKRSFPQEGGPAFVKLEKIGLTVIRMIREPKTDYEFELQLRFDDKGKLEGVIYKDVI